MCGNEISSRRGDHATKMMDFKFHISIVGNNQMIIDITLKVDKWLIISLVALMIERGVDGSIRWVSNIGYC